MSNLYYGNGTCTVEGTNIRGVQIKYRGSITIEDKTSPSFAIAHKNNGIMVFPIGEGYLNELFDYEGEFKIVYCRVRDWFDKMVPYTVTNNHLGYWEDAKTNWNTGGKWSDYSGTY